MDDYTDEELSDGLGFELTDEELTDMEYELHKDNWDFFADLFESVIVEMSEIYARHRVGKGDSWKKMNPEELRILFEHELEEYYYNWT